MMVKQKSYRLLFGLFILLYLTINISTLHDGHNWGGDFSQYIRHAKNIVEHKDYSSGILVEAWSGYPPGLPLLLTPLVSLFGINFILFKLPNIFYWLITVFCLFFIAKRHIGEENSVWISIVFLTSPAIFAFKQNVVSDFPFTMFTAASLLVFSKYIEAKGDDRQERFYLWGSLTLMSCAFLTRWLGFIIFACALFYLILHRKGLKPIGLTFVFLIGTLWVHKLFGVSPSRHLTEVPLDLVAWAKLSFEHITYSMQSIVASFFSNDSQLGCSIFFRIGCGCYVKCCIFVCHVYRYFCV